ncbi:RIB43A-like with coiled-coils protein 2 isoform X1 [Polyodon spathula]|uniref:RIB43A-like with coiled-coils protein 2 isoform X1 n=2 Tax=Polyodon spathula TaxID=7913 RepID=UPI001B7F07C1|nr:RIB43A-like with coiled-coils protein 2 isoform X1 [Polyodon spathula]
MYKLDLPKDLAMAAALEQRRNREIERQNRIFNSKVRIIGVDKEALDYQVKEKKIKEETDAHVHEAYAKDLIRNEKIACLLDNRQKNDSRALNKAVEEFRQCFQKPESRREFYLSDPQMIKKDLPARVSDHDPRLSISGVQKLVGEDLNQQERHRMQQEQLREWSLQQQEELHRAREEHACAEELYNKTRVELDNRAVELQKIEEETRRAITVATKDFNLAKAAETREKQKLEKQQEEEDNLVEISNLIQGDLLSENPDQAVSVFGPHRVVPDRWKGMRPEQLKEITHFQQQQVQENMRSKERELLYDLEWKQQCVDSARKALLLERQQARLERELRRALDNTNKQLSEAHRAQKQYLEKEVFTNIPEDGYFAQFNTTSR